MKRVLKVTKTTKVVKIKEMVDDLLSDMSDEEVLEKHHLRWDQLEKIYAKLYYSGYLCKDDLKRRVSLRNGKDVGHIPLAEIDEAGNLYECTACGFASPLHFSTCPRCREVNLRRLTRRIAPPSASDVVREASLREESDAVQNAARQADYVFDHLSYWGNYL